MADVQSCAVQGTVLYRTSGGALGGVAILGSAVRTLPVPHTLFYLIVDSVNLSFSQQISRLSLRQNPPTQSAACHRSRVRRPLLSFCDSSQTGLGSFGGLARKFRPTTFVD